MSEANRKIDREVEKALDYNLLEPETVARLVALRNK